MTMPKIPGKLDFIRVSHLLNEREKFLEISYGDEIIVAIKANNKTEQQIKLHSTQAELLASLLTK